MQRKKQAKFKQSRQADRPRSRRFSGGSLAGRDRNQPRPHPIAEEILGLLHQNPHPLSLPELLDGLGLGRSHRREIAALLTGLCKARTIRCLDDRTYSLGDRVDLIEGVVQMHPRGFGFAMIPGRQKGNADPFISPPNLGSANHGDTALFILLGKERGREQARVVRVLKRSSSRLVGIYQAGRKTGQVLPVDDRLLFKVIVKSPHAAGALDGQAVVAEILEYHPADTGNPAGRIIEVLGDPADLLVQTEIVIRSHDLPHTFSPQALAEAETAVPPADEPNRQDLRQVMHVTIDGEDARDFDDAVAISRTSDGFRLHVSIADVSHYVRPGSQLDQEAYQRGTSVYFANKVVPMLPERLSNDLCSLVPNQDRPAFSAILDFDRNGKRTASRFTKSFIKSRRRLTYTKVWQLLENDAQPVERDDQDLLKKLKLMAELAGLLERNRMTRGSIGFSLPEPAIRINADSSIESIARLERNLAHKIIEEFMLAANEAVAEALATAHIPTLYRIHEQPDPVKIEEFSRFAATMDLELPPAPGSPHWFARILSQAAGTPKEYIVNNLLLRTMQRARYSPDNVGHFGLAASNYTHFTSPIRRYPDLMVHRALAAMLARTTTAAAGLAQDGDFLSGREQAAVEAERDLAGLLQARYMQDKIGQTFAGIISGVTQFGLFVELLEQFISGAVPMTKLKDDYYQYDEKHHRLIGSGAGKIFRLGDLVTVRLAGVDLPHRKIDFELAE